VFDHVTIRVADRRASEQFYDTVLETLGLEQTYQTKTHSEWGEFSLAAASAARPATQRLHVGFAAPSRAQVDRFWENGTEAGYASDGAPGPRAYTKDYYGAFLLDPDGNSVEAVHYRSVRRGGTVDHLWIRVTDLAASRRFYTTIAPHAGIRLERDTPERVQFSGPTGAGSFSLLEGEPTRDLHMAFASENDADVRRFHEAAIEAGYRSDGPPGERPRYHPGYYAAYVLDPDGNSVELVNHHRS
jgi:catechol 2,3-dioxygenase-like lactoylglutathione lyase family enzyme